MENLEFQITIDAPREKVWKALWEDKSYREWTSPFSEGSWAESDWKKGSRAMFYDGNKNGLVAIIDESIPNEFMSFRHMGMIEKGVEYMDRREDDVWRGAHENYKLTDVNGKTLVEIMLEPKGMGEKMKDEFRKMWPQALEKLKAVAERK